MLSDRAANHTCHPERPRPFTVTVTALAGLAMLLAACGGGHASPHVASLPTSTTLGASTSLATGHDSGSAATTPASCAPSVRTGIDV